MRITPLLISIQNLKSLGAFSAHFDSDYKNGNWRYTVSNLPQLREKLEAALSIPVVQKIAELLYTSKPLRMAYAEVDIQSSAYPPLKALADKIDVYLESMELLLKSIGASDSGDAEISVKLSKASNLSEVNIQLESLDQTLTQALSVLPEPPTLRVSRWENGSLWIDLLVGSAAGVMLIGGVTWAAACAFKKFQEGKLIEKASESLGIKNEVLGSLRDGVAFAIETVIQAEAKRLDEKHSKNKGDAETIQRLQHCIRQTFDMIKEGTEIHPALMMPEDVKNVFPNMAELLALPSAQKLLKEHAEAEGEQSTPPEE